MTTPPEDRHKTLSALIAAGVPVAIAGERAGYADPSGTYRALQHPAVRAGIIAEVARLLAVEGAPLALRVLLDVTADTAAPARVRVDAAKTLLDRAGLGARIAPDRPDKPLAEMTGPELRAIVDRLEGELAGRARPIAPSGAGPSADAPDFLD